MFDDLYAARIERGQTEKLLELNRQALHEAQVNYSAACRRYEAALKAIEDQIGALADDAIDLRGMR